MILYCIKINFNHQNRLKKHKIVAYFLIFPWCHWIHWKKEINFKIYIVIQNYYFFMRNLNFLYIRCISKITHKYRLLQAGVIFYCRDFILVHLIISNILILKIYYFLRFSINDYHWLPFIKLFSFNFNFSFTINRWFNRKLICFNFV